MSLIREKVGYKEHDGKGPGSKYAKYVNNCTARLLRRWAKREPENAPRRVRDVTRGWWS